MNKKQLIKNQVIKIGKVSQKTLGENQGKENESCWRPRHFWPD